MKNDCSAAATLCATCVLERETPNGVKEPAALITGVNA
jgi:hypothetical protein